MIAQIVLATALGTAAPGATTDPLDAALDYVKQMEATVADVEAQEAAEIAAEIEAEQAQQDRRQAVDRPTRNNSRELPPTENLPSLLLTIRANESGGNYGAYNATGCEGYGCYGAYQLHGLYMDDWANRYGAASYVGSPATQWPSGVQDRVALGLFYSTNPNGIHWCNWTDYC